MGNSGNWAKIYLGKVPLGQRSPWAMFTLGKRGLGKGGFSKTGLDESGSTEARISLILVQDKKNYTTLFPSTLKVKENKVILYFHFVLRQATYGHFLMFDIFMLKIKVAKHEIVHILLVLAKMN